MPSWERVFGHSLFCGKRPPTWWERQEDSFRWFQRRQKSKLRLLWFRLTHGKVEPNPPIEIEPGYHLYNDPIRMRMVVKYLHRDVVATVNYNQLYFRYRFDNLSLLREKVIAHRDRLKAAAQSHFPYSDNSRMSSDV